MAEPADQPPPAPASTDPAAATTLLERLGSAGATAASLGGEQSRWRRVAIAGLVVAALACLVYFVVSQWSRLPPIEWRFHAGWLALSVAALIVFQALQCQLWVWVLRGLGSPIPVSRAWSIFSVTMLARYVPTNLAMVVGRTAMGEREGVPKRVSVAGIVLQLGVTLAGAAALGAYFVIVLPDLQDQPLRFAALAVPVLALILLEPSVFGRVTNRVLRRLGREPLPLALSRRRVLALALVSAVSFAVAGVAVWAFAETVHGVAAADVPTVIGSYSIGYAAAVVTLVLPAGLGVREGAILAALAPVLPLTVAIAAAVAVRLLQVGVELAFAALTPVWARHATAAGAGGTPP